MYSWQAVGMHSTGRLSWHCLQSLGQGNFYRPQRSSGKVIFSQVCVILFTGGSASVHARIPPRPGTPPPCRACWEIRSTRGWYTSYCNAIFFHRCLSGGGCLPMGRGRCTSPPDTNTPLGKRSTSARYASYWNAFMLYCCQMFFKYKARYAHKRLYTVLPKYSKIQVLPGITSCRSVKNNKQAIELNSLLINNMPEGGYG